MRISPVMRGARAFALATLVFSLGLSPSFARMGGSAGGSFARPAFGGGHFKHFAPGGFNRRFEAGRFGFNRFGPNRFNRFGFSRFNRFGGNQLFVGGWGWGGWGGYSASASSQPTIVGDTAPVIINIGVDPAPGDAAGASSGGCVIHKLNYDSNGKYVGERQIPHC
ncbi:MAG TPA: hypothetical protein VIJ63_05865 [Roseiarcus sp.]